MATCCGALTERIARHFRRRQAGGQGGRDGYIEALCFKIMLFAAVITSYPAATAWFSNDAKTPFLGYLGLASTFAFLSMSLWLWVRRRLTPQLLRLYVFLIVVMLALMDFAFAPSGRRTWPLFVLVVDFLLVIEAERWIMIAVVTYVCIHLSVIEAEYTYRFGLFDAPGLLDYESRRRACECAAPPCSYADVSGSMFRATLALPARSAFAAMVFIIDFVLTQGFAHRARSEQKKVQAAIDATEHVARSLSRYDLHTAAEYLEEHAASLPAEVASSFHVLLANLESYRAFLPQEFFHREDRSESSEGERILGIPGCAAPKAAIVFTDICSSTLLWEHSGEDTMHAALGTHNNLMRSCLGRHSGYEVKTIGDAFMIAFNTASEAVAFGIDVQTELARDGLWPEGLHRPNTDGMNVLTVRVGIHIDEVRAEKNVLTQRYDYFGRAVNKAARVEQHACPGAVTVTEEVMHELTEDEAFDIERHVWVLPFAAVRKGKGLAEPLRLTTLLPRAVEVILPKAREHAAAPAAAMHRTGNQSSASLEMSADGSQTRPQQVRMNSLTSVMSSNASVSSSMSCPTETRKSIRAAVGTVKLPAAAAAVAREKCDFTDGSAPPASVLEAMNSHVVRTQGHLTAVSNGMALVSWGVHKACRQPVNESVRFVMNLCKYFGPICDEPVPFFAGLATGPTASSVVRASPTQRFVSLAGLSVDVSMSLCASAAELRTPVLAASVAGEHAESFSRNEFLHGHIRPVDTWRINGRWTPRRGVVHEDLDYVTVFELRMHALVHAVREQAQPPPPAAWSIEYIKAFRAGDAAAMRQMADASCQDRPLGIIADMLDRGTHLPHALLSATEDSISETPQDLNLSLPEVPLTRPETTSGSADCRSETSVCTLK